MKIFTLLTLLLTIQTSFANEAAVYIGRDVCKSCHLEQDKLWQGSHHDLAMQKANDATVLGDFNNVSFSYAGTVSRFFKNKDTFMVATDGPDGQLHEYAIKYTFGVVPLQQYLIEMKNGRLQALSIAWDTRKKSEGGQRWFHLYPDESITFEDELHWTRPSFNWNSTCAECHSTNLKKNYNSSTDIFKTSWSEIDVSCEACHGPASNHITWAHEKKQTNIVNKGFNLQFDERKDTHWTINQKTGNALRSKQRSTDKEIEVCAQCHSRRSSISDSYKPGMPFSDHYKPRLLDQGLYFSDGQIQDEVFVYGSFLQSKMYQKGVTCSDCHEPHSLVLRQEGNGVCLQCHAAEKFDNKNHHFHDTDGAGGQCAECHMPTRNYMMVDPRHDHSIRIPRPDLSVSLGTPNACNQCHDNKDTAWAQKQVSRWYKPTVKYQQYAYALDAGRQSKNNAGKKLAAQISKVETPDIARATAVSIITPYLDGATIGVLQDGLIDSNALVRRASVTALEGLAQNMVEQMAFPLLDDPVRSVRIEAARVLAPMPVGQLADGQLRVYNQAAKEYVYSQTVNAERPEAQLNLGYYYAAKGEVKKSINAYKTAIKLNDMFIPAYINLADLYRTQKNDAKAEKQLRYALKIAPDNAAVHYALGLSLIRQKRNTEALGALKSAVDYDSTNAHYVYVYAVALNSTGDVEQAVKVLQSANISFPQDANILKALVALHRDADNEFSAQTYMKKLQKLK